MHTNEMPSFNRMVLYTYTHSVLGLTVVAAVNAKYGVQDACISTG